MSGILIVLLIALCFHKFLVFTGTEKGHATLANSWMTPFDEFHFFVGCY